MTLEGTRELVTRFDVLQVQTARDNNACSFITFPTLSSLSQQMKKNVATSQFRYGWKKTFYRCTKS